ncbi:MAG: hypothetical protein PUP91_32465 [Rhizonema sp. PD37]|nr:hypothetical protein [Rhizonema sp. PD37]
MLLILFLPIDINMQPKKSNKTKKTLPSQMIRVPTPLIKGVKELSRLHRLGLTNAVIQGLQSLISNIDSNNDIDNGISNETIKQLSLRLEKLESRNSNDSDVDSNSISSSVTSLSQKLEALQTRIAQVENAIRVLEQRQLSTPTRRQPFNFHPPQLELEAYTGENLAKRLGIDLATLEREKMGNSPKNFESWCRSKDPSSMAWRPGKDGLYHPVK